MSEDRDVSGLIGRLTATRVEGFEVDFTDWGYFPGADLGGVWWRNHWHRHTYLEVCLANSGSGVFRHGDESFSVAAGDLFLARRGVLHEIESHHDDPLGISFWGFDLTPGRRAPRVGEGGWWSGLFRGAVVSRRVGQVPALLQALAAEAGSFRSGHRPVTRALGAALVVETGRAFSEAEELVTEPPALDRSEQSYAVMHRFLQDNLAQPVSVRDVASAAHLSDRQAERLFHRHGGASMMTVLRRLRIERAARLLRADDAVVGGVAAEVGYTDLPSFRAAFKAVTGQSPRDFRRTNGTVHLG
ncbi:helix-turn-helix domain-containing protein [Aestuariimicrobium kwangyangense]|uniref:helix-turn-helix domain-containing protein n=1 Tax=Aestuariimicrobium kwangyangense TaxID=396389 RepID=UPI0003B428EA|nr:AraC family transcriptional regulator [Aestuariimicrobium kwangyangense]